MSQLTYDVFVCDAIPQAITSLVPDGERRTFSPLSVTLISGDEDAVLVDPPLVQWVAAGQRADRRSATGLIRGQPTASIGRALARRELGSSVASARSHPVAVSR